MGKGSDKTLGAIQKAQEAASAIVLLSQEAISLVERSEYREHLYDVAGNILEKLPQEILRLQEQLAIANKSLLGTGKQAYTPPFEDMSGYQTFVRRNEDTSEGTSDTDRTKERALPLPSSSSTSREPRLPGNSEGAVPQVSLNSPPGTGGGNEGLSKTRTKQRPIPGEQYGTPYKDTPLLTRRVMEGAWKKSVKLAIWREYFA